MITRRMKIILSVVIVVLVVVDILCIVLYLKGDNPIATTIIFVVASLIIAGLVSFIIYAHIKKVPYNPAIHGVYMNKPRKEVSEFCSIFKNEQECVNYHDDINMKGKQTMTRYNNPMFESGDDMNNNNLNARRHQIMN